MHIEMEQFSSILTPITSRSPGDGMIELGMDSSNAIRTPPPRILLSLR